MASATPGPTIFDIANLQMMQNWAQPAIAEIQRRRQLEEAMAREFRVQQFAQDQQDRQIKGYGENQVRAVEAQTKLDREESGMQRTASEESYKTAESKRIALKTELTAATQALNTDIRRKAEIVAKSFNPTNPIANEADVLQIIANGQVKADPSLALRVQALTDEYENALRTSSTLLGKIVQYGGKVPVGSFGPAATIEDATRPLPPNTFQEGDYLGTNSPPAKSKTKPGKKDTEGYVTEAARSVKGVLGDMAESLKSEFRQVADPVYNLGVDAFGGEFRLTPEALGTVRPPTTGLPFSEFDTLIQAGALPPRTEVPIPTLPPDFSPYGFAPQPQLPVAVDPFRWGGTTPPRAPALFRFR